MRRVCVYCGSSPGAQPEYVEAARELGRVLAGEGLGVIYGGSNVGLMGQLANGALEAGGEVIGVIPRMFVNKGIDHWGLTEVRVVDSMHASWPSWEMPSSLCRAEWGHWRNSSKCWRGLNWVCTASRVGS